MKTIDKAFIQTFYKKRIEDSHKGNYGHALVIAGSLNKMGASLIASKACLRSGVGLLTLSIPKEERQTVTTFLPEAMVHFREEIIDFSLYEAVGIGPGIEKKNPLKSLFMRHFLK
ncbi:MAG: hypothetical protein HC854_04590 [Flavobacterium sp.]|nr:hypothetical protein [Flavobacterium sp.]